VTFRIRSGTQAVTERRFSPAPEQCDHLHAVVGLAVALAIRASLVRELVGLEPRTDDRPWSIGLEPSVARGVSPGWAFGAEVRAERALSKALALRAGAFGLLDPRGTFEDVSGHFRTLLVAARVDGCGVIQLSERIDGRACQGFAGGVLDAQGSGFVRSTSSVVRWLAVANSVDVTFHASSAWSWNLGVELLVPLERTSIVARGPSGAVVASDDLSAAGVVVSAGPLFHF
jgi:hypothetical protein